MTLIRPAVHAFLFALVFSSPAVAADPPWRIAAADGSASLTFCVLAQPQFEAVTTADGADTAQHFLIRRTRLILGGKLGDRISFFIDTDAPNIGKPNATGRKGEDAMFLQDVALTFAVTPNLNLEGGLIIVPVGRHATQSAATLLGVDYGPFSFSHSDPTNCRMGRDYGVQRGATWPAVTWSSGRGSSTARVGRPTPRPCASRFAACGTPSRRRPASSTPAPPWAPGGS